MTATAMELPLEYAQNPEPTPLAGLSGIWLRFHLLTITPLQLSAYKGSTFHGAFGWALRRLYRPLYDQLYEPAATLLPAGDSARVALPKPFVLVPPLDTQCEKEYGADSTHTFAGLMVLLLRNQSHTLELLSVDIGRQNEQLVKEYAPIADRFKDVFDFLIQCIRHQKRILWFIGGVVVLGLWILPHLVYFFLTPPAKAFFDRVVGG